MKKMIGRVICWNLEDWRIYMAIPLCAAVLGQIILMIIMALDAEATTVPPVAAAFALYGTAFLVAILHVVYYVASMDIPLSMGVTRRVILLGQLLSMLCAGIILAAETYVLTWLTYGLNRLLYGAQCEPPFAVTPWWAYLLAILVPVLLGPALGGVLRRTGKVGGIVVYVLLCGTCFWGSGLEDLFTAQPELGVPALCAAGAAVLVLLVLGVRWILRTPAKR